MLAFLRLLNLRGADAFLLEALFRNAVWKEHLVLPVSEENEAMVCESMLAGCREAVEAFGGSMEEDRRAFRDARGGSR